MLISNFGDSTPAPRGLIIRVVGCAMVALIFGAGTARAGDMSPMVPATGAVGPSAALDGQAFVGEFGLVGHAARGTDTWIFQNGSFVSKGCVECGFPQSVYSTRLESGDVSFKSKTNCPVSDAQIFWEGTVSEGRIEGVYTWVKKRWYRTIEQKFWFRGTVGNIATDITGNTL